MAIRKRSSGEMGVGIELGDSSEDGRGGSKELSEGR